MVIGTTWMVALRCPNCHKLFTVKGIRPAQIADIGDRSKCPHCNHEPGPPVAPFAGKRHLIVKLESEKEDR